MFSLGHVVLNPARSSKAFSKPRMGGVWRQLGFAVGWINIEQDFCTAPLAVSKVRRYGPSGGFNKVIMLRI